VQVKAPLFGSSLVSLPFTSYGGIVADSAEVAAELLQNAAALARRLGATRIELRHLDATVADLPTSHHKVTMWLDLPASEEALWEQLPTKLRTDIRKRRKEGLDVRIGRAEELVGFYRIYAANMRDLGTPVYPRAFFDAVLEEWGEEAWVATCHREGVPLASALLVGFQGTIEMPWASSLRQHRKLRPNMLLYWECLRHAVAFGYTRFDFGRSTPESGPFEFKKSWGARQVPLQWQYWLSTPGDSVPLLTPDNPRFAYAIRAWRQMPLWLTTWLGPRIVRYLP
jgi:FemAB-related protein (PEP-CTERM system-associated)